MCCTPLCVNKHKEGKQDLSPPTLCVVHHLQCVKKHKEGKQDLSPATICVVHHYVQTNTKKVNKT